MNGSKVQFTLQDGYFFTAGKFFPFPFNAIFMHES